MTWPGECMWGGMSDRGATYVPGRTNTSGGGSSGSGGGGGGGGGGFKCGYTGLEDSSEMLSDDDDEPETLEAPTEQEFLCMSNKVLALFALLALSVNQGDKMLVFSQSIFALDLIELCLGMRDWGNMVRTEV